MTRQRYSIRESINRILRLFSGKAVSENPNSLTGEVLSVNEAGSDLAELFNDSLPNETLTIPSAVSTAIETSGFATGTVSDYGISAVTGTSILVTDVEKFVFGGGLQFSVTGTSLYLDSAVSNYKDIVAGVQSANLIAYWPLDETSGTNADNYEGTAARDGTYSGVTLNSSTGPFGGASGLWDGNNDYTDIHSASLNGVIDFAEGGMSVWVKVSTATDWDGATNKFCVGIRDNIAPKEIVQLYKSGANELTWMIAVAGNAFIRTKSGITDANWIHLALSWSDTNNRMRAYWNGAQEGLDLDLTNSPGPFTLTAGWCNVGCADSSVTPTFPWPGYLAHVALWGGAELTADDVTTLYNGGPAG